MAYTDLRDFIQALEQAGELKRIPFEVDPHLEITEFADRAVKRNGPALLFEKPKGSSVPLLINAFGAVPFLRGPAYGPSLLSAALVLAIMILPYVASVAREVIIAVPQSQREAALALGATRWEMIRDAVLPYARSGLVGGVMLGLGRALGETMAVTMVIGNRHAIPSSLLDPAYTMSALLANEFAEASSDTHLSSLMAVAGLLLLVTLIVNVLARWLVWRVGHDASRRVA